MKHFRQNPLLFLTPLLAQRSFLDVLSPPPRLQVSPGSEMGPAALLRVSADHGESAGQAGFCLAKGPGERRVTAYLLPLSDLRHPAGVSIIR